MQRIPKARKLALLVAAALLAGFGSSASATDFAALRTKWNARTGNAPALAADDPDVALQPAGAASPAQTYWNDMDKTSGRTYLWSTLPLGSAGLEKNLTSSFSRLNTLISAWKSSSSPLYHDAAVKQGVLDAIDWLLNNHYNDSGTGSIGYGNWWEWQIGTPTQLNSIVTGWYSDLGADRVADIYASIDHFVPSAMYRYNHDGTVMTSGGIPVVETGANRSNKAVIILIRGIFGDREDKIQNARDAVPAVMNEVTLGNDGFYADGTFIQHFNIPYIGSYGSGLLADIAKLYYFFDATSPWTLATDPNYGKPAKWAMDSYAPVIYDGGIFDSQRGRGIAAQFMPDHLAGRATIMALAELAYVLPQEQATPVKSAIKGWVTRDDFFTDANTTSYFNPYPVDETGLARQGVTKYQIALVKGILNDTAIPTAPEPQEVRTFPSGDRVVARGPGYGFNVSMFSFKRITASEAGNKENLEGWWTGAGMTTLYNADHRRYANDYWATVNRKRLPGTTTDQSMKTGTYIDWATWGNTKEVTGSVELNRQYGAAGMDFGMTNVTGSTLTGKKAWFMFGDSIAAAGTGISGGSGTVETIVENAGLNSSGNNVLTVDEPVTPLKPDGYAVKSTAIPWNEDMAAIGWAHVAGNTASGSDVGYVFPDKPTVTGARESRTDNWRSLANATTNPNTSTPKTRNYLSLAIGHGSAPVTNKDYAYIVLPNATVSSTRAFAAANPIKFLERSTDAIAAEHQDLGVTGAVFWNRAVKTITRNGFNLLSSDKPAIVTMKQQGNDLQLAVADPIQVADTANGQQLSGTINLEFHRPATAVVSNDPAVTVTQLAPTVKMQVNTSLSAGRSIKADFTLADTVTGLAPTADAYVRDGTYAATNYGTASTLAVKSEVVGYNRHALLKFDLSSVNGMIASARLRLMPVAVGTTPNMVHNLYQTATASWTESGVNWSNQPANASLVTSWTVPAVLTLVEADITSAAVKALNGDKQLSLEIEAAANYGSNGSVDYGSKNNSNVNYRPVLVITTN